MSDQIRVNALSALEELRTATGRFSSEFTDIIEDTEREIARKKEVLDQLVGERARNVTYWRREYDSADPEEDDIGSISRRLSDAEDDLGDAKRWQKKVEDLYHIYSRRASLGLRISTQDAVKANAILAQKIKELYDYIGLGVTGTAYVTGMSGSPKTMAPAIAKSVVAGDQTHVNNYEKYMNQVSDKNIVFEELGEQYIDVGDIMPMASGENAWNEQHDSFWKHHGNSREFYESMARDYSILKERLTHTSLAELKRDPNTRVGAEFWWSTSDKIKLTRFEGSYFVENGFHRVALAKEQGLGEIPCIVTEARLKNYTEGESDE